MKKIVLILLLTVLKLNAQQGTLIYTTSFETKPDLYGKYCTVETYIDTIGRLTSYLPNTFSARYTPDVFTPFEDTIINCSFGEYCYTCFNVPNNFAGQQYPNTGNCYVGMCTFSANGDIFSYTTLEVLGINMNKILKANTDYLIEYYVNLAENNNWAPPPPKYIFIPIVWCFLIYFHKIFLTPLLLTH